VTQLVQDLRYALRSLRSSPGFTIVALLTLAVGIGANTAIFSFVDAVLLKPLPYQNADRIVRVLEKRPDGGFNGISTLNYLDWKNQNTSFLYMANQTGGQVTLTGQGDPIMLRGNRVGVHYFDIFGIKPESGRTFAEGEDQLGKDKVAVISHALWEKQFGSDPQIVGKTVILDNQPNTIIGVLPRGSSFDRGFPQIWRPLAFEPSNMTRNFHWFGAFALVKDSVSVKQAQTEMDGIGARIAKDFPDSNKGWGVSVIRLSEATIGPEMRTSLLVLMAAVGGVLLIGCANLANLSLARGVAREREVAVRAALGAGRWRLIRQFLTENVVLSLTGGVAGILLGFAGMAWLKSMIPPFTLPREADIQLDPRVLIFALAISVFTGILFGLAPALQATNPDLSSHMKDGGRGSSTGGSRGRLRDALVVAEVAVAFVLLAVAGLLIKSFFGMITNNPGFDSTNVLAFGVPTTDKLYPDPQRANEYFRQLSAAVQAVPGVRETALTCAVPLQGSCYGMPMQAAGHAIVDRANRNGGFVKIVSPSYFHALGIRLLKGRFLNDHDTRGAPFALVMGARLAQKFFPGEEPVGQRLLIQEMVPGKTELGPEIAWEIVGIISDEKVNALNDEKSAGVYVPYEQSPVYFQNMIVKANLSPESLEKAVQNAIHSVNKDQALVDIKTLDQIKTESMQNDQLGAMLMSTFSAVALLLAAIGIYGVISYSVAQRTHEMGIRSALGASAPDLLRMVLVRGMMLTLIGLAIGLAGTLAVSRLLVSIIYNVGARDPYTMGSVALILALISLAACFIPARRATKVDPLVALRYE
jgi:putative ABC transport system permease protein